MSGGSFKKFVIDQLAPLGPVEARAMFGGHGLYHLGVFFGIIFKGRLYFKTDETTRDDYVEAGMKPFSPSRKQTLKNYYEVPPDVLDDHERLMAYAEKAIKCAEGGAAKEQVQG